MPNNYVSFNCFLMAYHVAAVSLQLIQGDNLSQLCVLRWLHGIIMSSLQASKLCLYKQFDMVPILKLLNTPYSFTIQNLVLLSQSEQLLQNLSLNCCTTSILNAVAATKNIRCH